MLLIQQNLVASSFTVCYLAQNRTPSVLNPCLPRPIRSQRPLQGFQDDFRMQMTETLFP